MEDLGGLSERYKVLIKQLTERSDVPGLIERYLNPTEPYAAFSFDTAGDNPPFELTNDDLLALNFLDAPIRPMSYRRLMELKPAIDSQLLKLSPDLHLWQMNQESQAYKDADRLWRMLTDVYGVGCVRASKIMARKRPKLIPILDRWVASFFEGRTEPFWSPLGIALQDQSLRRAVEGMRPPGLATGALSLLRILDIAIWMVKGRPPPDESGDEL